MSEEKGGRRGRPPLSVEERQKRKNARLQEFIDLHIWYPTDLINNIDKVTDNRTQWLVDAATQRWERESEASNEQPENQS